MADTMNHIERGVAALTEQARRPAVHLSAGHGSGRRLRGRRQDDLPRVGLRTPRSSPRLHRRAEVLRLRLGHRPDGPVRHGRRPGRARPHGRAEHPVRRPDRHQQPRGLREAAGPRHQARAAATSWSRAPACSSRRWATRSSPPRFLEGPLLALTQTAGAEKRLHGHGQQQERRAHKALETITELRRGHGQGLRHRRQARRPRVGLPVGQLLLPRRQGVRRVRGHSTSTPAS